MDESPFIAALADDPRDEGAWMVYADWLEEQGDVRGEYLRLVCEIDRVGIEMARDDGLLGRLAELTSEHVIEFPGDSFKRFATDERVRGFFVGVQMSGAEFAEHGYDVMKWSPIRSLELSAVGEHAETIASCPDLTRLRRLSIKFERQRVGNVTAILRSPHLDHLEELQLPGCILGRSTFEAIAALPSRLRRLGFHDWRWKPEWLKLLLGRTSTAELESLSLAGCEHIGERHVPLFERILATPSLTELDLSRTPIPTSTIERLRDEYGDRVTIQHSSPLR